MMFNFLRGMLVSGGPHLATCRNCKLQHKAGDLSRGGGAHLGTAARMFLNTNRGWEVLWALLLACPQGWPHEHPAASALGALKSTMCFHPAPCQAAPCTSQGISSTSEMILNTYP